MHLLSDVIVCGMDLFKINEASHTLNVAPLSTALTAAHAYTNSKPTLYKHESPSNKRSAIVGRQAQRSKLKAEILMHDTPRRAQSTTTGVAT